MFAVGVALLVAGYGLAYTGLLTMFAEVKGGGQLPAFRDDQAQPAPTLLEAFGYAQPIGPVLGKSLTPGLDISPSGVSPPTTGSGGAPEAPGPVTININGKPVSLVPGLLPGIIIGPGLGSPTAGLTPLAVR